MLDCQLSAVSQAQLLAKARCKNISGPTAGSGGTLGGYGGDDQPRRLTAVEKGKAKKLATKNRKASDREAEVAKAAAAAGAATERGGERSLFGFGN